MFSRVKQEYHDIDYSDQLTDEEKEWMSTFMDEYLGANMNHGKENIHGEDHDCFTRNNARNRDDYSRAKAQNGLIDIDPKYIVEALQSEYDWADTTEDQLIEQIDLEKSVE